MRIPQTVWLKFSLQRWVSWSLYCGQMMPNPMWEQWGWGQKQLALLRLSAQPGIEAAHCLHSYPICLSWKQLNTIFWINGASQDALLPTQRKSDNIPFWRRRSLVSTSHLLTWTVFFPTFYQNIWMIQSLPERVTKLLECLVECLDSLDIRN